MSKNQHESQAEEENHSSGKNFISSGSAQTELQKIQDLLMNSKPEFKDHVKQLSERRELYVAELLLQLHTVDVNRQTKVTAALAAFELKDEILIKSLLADIDNYSLPEVLALCHHLDSDRRVRSLEAKIKAMRTTEIQGFEKTPPPKGDGSSPRKAPEKPAPTAARGRGRGGARGRGARGRGAGGAPTTTAGDRKDRKDKKSEGRNDQEKLFRRVMRTIKKIKAFEAEIPKRKAEKVEGLTATLSGKNCSYFRDWAGRITELSLRHFMLEFGSLSMWTELADMIHINPEQMNLPTFLPYAHDNDGGDKGNSTSGASKKSELTADIRYALDLKKRLLPDPNAAKKKMKSRAARRRNRTAPANLMDELDSIVKHQVPFTLLRKLQPAKDWPEKLKVAVAKYTDVTTVFWWIEEFRCDGVEKQLNERLSKDDLPKFGYGKLMERLMWCNGARSKVLPPLIPYAESCLQDYTLPLKTPMAVLGDCSGSMQVAVRTASIIVSLLTALGQAELFFFNDRLVKPPFIPSTIREAIICSDEVKADGPTSPAAALEPLYKAKKRMETLVVVTDEQENDPGPETGLLFHELFTMYRNEVSPNAFLVLVSFLGPSEEGQMATALQSCKVPFLQCRLSRDRPDLTKLDMLLGKLSMETTMHKVAAECCAVFLATKPSAEVASREIKKFTASFVREGTGGIVRFIKTMANELTEKPEGFEALKKLLIDFFSTLQESEFVALAISRITGIYSVEELQEWCDKEWSTNWTDEVGQNTFSTRPLNLQRRKVGTLTPLPREVVEHLMSWVPLKTLKEMEGAGSKTLSSLSQVARDMKFFAKFHEGPGEFDSQLEQINNMGLLEIFGEEETIKTLKRTKGNVDHAIALLFGEGRQ